MSREQLAAIVEMLRSQPLVPSGVNEMRAHLEQMAEAFPVAADIRSEPVDAGTVPAAWVSAPGAAEDRVILYLHGGGYAIGSIDSHRALAGSLSRTARARVLLIGYRLAPEHPFPAAVEDSTAAYRWLLRQGVEPSRIVIAGDSAGGGLTVATLVALRDAKERLPAGGVCISPWLDMEGSGESMTTRAAQDPMIQRGLIEWFASLYVGKGDRRAPLASPLYADLSGLPPLYVLVGTAETLLDDSVRLGERARKAGVQVTLEAWDGMIHVWPAFAAILDEGREAIDKIGEFVRRRTG
jgi:acetyl esterase/lipase